MSQPTEVIEDLTGVETLETIIAGPTGPAGSSFDIDTPIDYIRFDTTAGDPDTIYPGQMWWDTTDNTLALNVNDVTLQIGQELFIRGHNNTGVEIANGTPVSIPSTSSSTGTRAKIEPTDATSATSCRCYIGITTETIAHGAEGMVTRLGFVRGINTNSYNEGDRLWLTGGGR